MGSALVPELQPARRRPLSSGVEGLRSARSCRRCLGAQGDAPLPSAARGREGAARVGGFFPARNGLSASRTERAGVPAAAALRAAATHPLLSALGPKYFSAAVACPGGRDPGSALPRRGLSPGCTPRAAPDPANCPIAFIFMGAGLSLTFVCGENGGVLVIWKDERQMGMTRGLPYSLACEHNSVLNKSLTG